MSIVDKRALWSCRRFERRRFGSADGEVVVEFSGSFIGEPSSSRSWSGSKVGVSYIGMVLDESVSLFGIRFVIDCSCGFPM